jgi:hypothetical protein
MTIALPTIVSSAIIVYSPGIPQVQLTSADRGRVLALGWPQGRHPVVVTEYGFHRCHDDDCSSSDFHKLTFMRSHGSTAVGLDGSVLRADVFRQGTDHLELTRCQPGRDCESGRLELPSITDYPPLPRIGLAVAADGSLLVAVVQQRDRNRAKAELVMYQCIDTTCVNPQRSVIATFEKKLADVYGRELNVTATPDGKVGVVFDEAEDAFDCAATPCTDPQRKPAPNPLVSSDPGWFLPSPQPFAATAGGLVTASVRRDVPEDGLSIRLGSPAPMRNQIFLHTNGKRIPLNVVDADVTTIHLVTDGSNGVLAVEDTGSELLFAGLQVPA